jgi:hypothetical protein
MIHVSGRQKFGGESVPLNPLRKLVEIYEVVETG